MLLPFLVSRCRKSKSEVIVGVEIGILEILGAEVGVGILEILGSEFDLKSSDSATLIKIAMV